MSYLENSNFNQIGYLLKSFRYITRQDLQANMMTYQAIDTSHRK